MSQIKVDFAVYGLLKGGNEHNGLAVDVKSTLQHLIDKNNGIVKITSSCLGKDPYLAETKSFGAQIQRAGRTYYFACQEGQILDFEKGGYVIK